MRICYCRTTVVQASHAHWTTTELVLKIKCSHGWVCFWVICSVLLICLVMVGWYHTALPLQCQLVVRLKLQPCEDPSCVPVCFLLKVVLAILSIWSFDVCFGISLLFPHEEPLDFEMKLGWLPRSVWADWHLTHCKCLRVNEHSTPLPMMALNVAQQYN